MAKKLYSKSEARIRLEYSKISYEIRKQVKDLRAEIPNARVLGTLNITDFAGLKARKKMGLSTSPQHLKNTTKMLKKLRKSGALNVKNERRAMKSAVRTLNNMGYTGINDKNVGELFAFLDMVAAAGLDSLFGSDYWIKAFERAKRRGLSKDDLIKSIERMVEKRDKGREIKRAYLKKY